MEKMGRLIKSYYLYIIFSVCTVPVALKQATGRSETPGSDDTTKILFEEEPQGSIRNLTAVPIEDHEIFPKSCGQQKLLLPRGRIIGGTKASLGEYPWMARLMHKDKSGHKSFGCSGFLINTKYVVTAAHCTHLRHLQRRGPVFSVVLGEHNTETETDCTPGGTICAEPRQISRTAKVITHPNYNPDNNAHYNDIAMIQLKKAARFTDFVKPICLLRDDAQVPGRYFLSGWGKTENEPSSKIKMKVDISTFDKNECKQKYSLLSIDLRNSQICAGGEKQKDACTGDSGGPLMMSDENGTWYASGIVSYGIGCGMKGWPGVYTNIAKFLPWIKSQIALNSMLSVRSSKKKGKKRNKKTKTAKTRKAKN